MLPPELGVSAVGLAGQLGTYTASIMATLSRLQSKIGATPWHYEQWGIQLGRLGFIAHVVERDPALQTEDVTPRLAGILREAQAIQGILNELAMARGGRYWASLTGNYRRKLDLAFSGLQLAMHGFYSYMSVAVPENNLQHVNHIAEKRAKKSHDAESEESHVREETERHVVERAEHHVMTRGDSRVMESHVMARVEDHVMDRKGDIAVRPGQAAGGAIQTGQHPAEAHPSLSNMSYATFNLGGAHNMFEDNEVEDNDVVSVGNVIGGAAQATADSRTAMSGNLFVRNTFTGNKVVHHGNVGHNVGGSHFRGNRIKGNGVYRQGNYASMDEREQDLTSLRGHAHAYSTAADNKRAATV